MLGGTLIQALGTNTFLVILALTVSHGWTHPSGLLDALGYALAKPAIKSVFIVLNLYLLLVFLMYLKRLRVACRKNGLTLTQLANLAMPQQRAILRRSTS